MGCSVGNTQGDRTAGFKKRVFGQNKARDYEILKVSAYEPELTYQQIVEKLELKLTEERVCQILMSNMPLLLDMTDTLNPLANAAGRKRECIRMYRKRKIKDEVSKKDMADLIEQVRKEDDKREHKVIINTNPVFQSITIENKATEDISRDINNRLLMQHSKD